MTVRISQEILEPAISKVKTVKINRLDKQALRRTRASRYLVIVVFATLGGLAVVDISEDLAQGTSNIHLMVESAVVLFSLIAVMTAALILVRDLMEVRAANLKLAESLERSEISAKTWRNEAKNLLIGLGESINKQFDAWNLSPVEKEIALFLLKGLSHKEVAYIREVSDSTVRQQARAIYQKAGVIGRHGLAAFFLEDLALPIENSSTVEASDPNS